MLERKKIDRALRYLRELKEARKAASPMPWDHTHDLVMSSSNKELIAYCGDGLPKGHYLSNIYTANPGLGDANARYIAMLTWRIDFLSETLITLSTEQGIERPPEIEMTCEDLGVTIMWNLSGFWLKTNPNAHMIPKKDRFGYVLYKEDGLPEYD